MQPRMLGLVGGTTWHSTIDYYRLINTGFNDRMGGSHSAPCVIHSFDFEEILAINARKDWDALLEKMVAASIGLRIGGAVGIVLCANTMHMIADQLEERVRLPVINIVDATARAILAAGLTRVALLGTIYTMEMSFFTDRLARHGVAALIPSPDDRAFINTSIFKELSKGEVRDETRTRYLEIIDSLVGQGAEGAILGCTEIPLLIKQKDCRVPVFDTTALHAAAAVDFALSAEMPA